jgi:SAM-dependent methyltransferase
MLYVADIPSDEDLERIYGDYSSYKTSLSRRPSWRYHLLPVKPPDPGIEVLLESGGLRGKRLCEFGCSFGTFLRRARREGAIVAGVELDDQAIEALRRAGIGAGREVAANESFDIVCAFQFIEHLPHPGEFVETASRILVPDGRLLLAFPNGGEAERVGPGWIGYRVDLEHLNYFSVGTLARLVESAGLALEGFWESEQPKVRRGGDGRGGRLGVARQSRRLAARLWGIQGPDQGTYGLSALARKIPGEAGNMQRARSDGRVDPRGANP